MINSHGAINQEKINYNVYQSNIQDKLHSGAAVSVRKDTNHRLIDDFEINMLGVAIDTPQGNMHITTTHIPPRDLYLLYPDSYKILKSTHPVYIIGGFKCKTPNIRTQKQEH